MKLALLLLVGLSTLAPQEDAPTAKVTKADEYKSLREAAGQDVEKLWEVVEFCEENDLEQERIAVLETIVTEDVHDFRAHELLGYQLQDLEWVAPDEIENLSKQLFKCGDKWLPAEQADEYHSELEQWWRIPSKQGHFAVYATTKRWVAEEGLAWAEVVFHDLVRLYGRAPDERVIIVLLRDLEQFNVFTMGDPGKGKLGTENTGYSSFYGAYQAETWFDQKHEEFPRAAVAYWDISSNGSYAWGRLYIRHATGLAFAEALDPSSEFERAFARSLAGASQLDPALFWREKKIPMWIRFGGAVYAERFFYDASAENEDEDPYRLKTWTVKSAIQTLRPLADVFRFPLSPNDPDDARKLMAEAGLLVAFVLDGKCKPVEHAHAAFKSAFRSKKGIAEAVEGLQEAIAKHEPELFAFADLEPRAAPVPAEASAKEGAEAEESSAQKSGESDASKNEEVEKADDTKKADDGKKTEQPEKTDEPKEKDGSGAASGNSEGAASSGR